MLCVPRAAAYGHTATSAVVHCGCARSPTLSLVAEGGQSGLDARVVDGATAEGARTAVEAGRGRRVAPDDVAVAATCIIILVVAETVVVGLGL